MSTSAPDTWSRASPTILSQPEPRNPRGPGPEWPGSITPIQSPCQAHARESSWPPVGAVGAGVSGLVVCAYRAQRVGGAALVPGPSPGAGSPWPPQPAAGGGHRRAHHRPGLGAVRPGRPRRHGPAGGRGRRPGRRDPGRGSPYGRRRRLLAPLDDRSSSTQEALPAVRLTQPLFAVLTSTRPPARRRLRERATHTPTASSAQDEARSPAGAERSWRRSSRDLPSRRRTSRGCATDCSSTATRPRAS